MAVDLLVRVLMVPLLLSMPVTDIAAACSLAGVPASPSDIHGIAVLCRQRQLLALTDACETHCGSALVGMGSPGLDLVVIL